MASTTRLASNLGLCLGIALSAGCVEEAPERLELAERPIYHGEIEAGELGVVAITYPRPGTTRIRLCTGTVIGPQAVLTAKHCVFDEAEEDVWTRLPASAFTVSVTGDIQSPEGPLETAGAVEIWTTPGDYETSQALGGEDIAVLLLGSPLSVEPVAYGRSAPEEGDALRIVGFGFTEDDVLGRKYSGDVSIRAFDDGVFESEGDSWTCLGDSGGPALDPISGAVVGVTSIGPAGCRVDDSFFTRVDRYAATIDGLLGVEPPCEPAQEICNGEDDNCDGVVDEGCDDPAPDPAPTPDPAPDVMDGDPAPAAEMEARAGDSGGCASAPGRPGGGALLGGLLAVGIVASRRRRGGR